MIINESKKHNKMNESILSDIVSEIKKNYPQLHPSVSHMNGMGSVEIKDIPDNLVDRVNKLAQHLVDKNNGKIVHISKPDGLYGKNNYLTLMFKESITEGTEKKSNGKWVNKGKDGEHGEFDTKSEADAQRKAMYANGFS